MNFNCFFIFFIVTIVIVAINARNYCDKFFVHITHPYCLSGWDSNWFGVERSRKPWLIHIMLWSGNPENVSYTHKHTQNETALSLFFPFFFSLNGSHDCNIIAHGCALNFLLLLHIFTCANLKNLPLWINAKPPMVLSFVGLEKTKHFADR